MLSKDRVGIPGEFAIVTVNVVLAVHVFHRHLALVGETVPIADRHHHPLAKQRHDVVAFVGFLAGQGVDDQLEIAADQPRAEVLRIGVAQA